MESDAVGEPPMLQQHADRSDARPETQSEHAYSARFLHLPCSRPCSRPS